MFEVNTFFAIAFAPPILHGVFQCINLVCNRRRSLVFRFGGGLTHGERGARTYNGGLAAVPPAGSRSRAPGGGSGGEAPLKLKTFRVLEFERSYILTTNLLSLPLL